MRYLVVAFAVASLSGSLSAQQSAQQKSTPANADSGRALLDKYCVTCHNARLKTANLTFDKMDLALCPTTAQFGNEQFGSCAAA